MLVQFAGRLVNPQIKSSHGFRIVYDADRIEAPARQLFNGRYWEGLGSILGKAAGRGSALFVDAPFGQVVLKKYLRGGQVSRWNKDRYLFTGYERSRPFREFRLLRWMGDWRQLGEQRKHP